MVIGVGTDFALAKPKLSMIASAYFALPDKCMPSLVLTRPALRFWYFAPWYIILLTFMLTGFVIPSTNSFKPNSPPVA